MNLRYVSTLYIECQICTYIRKWYIQLLGIRTSISKNNIPFCRLNDREKKFTVTVTETPFEKAILFPLLLRNTATSKNHYMLAIVQSIFPTYLEATSLKYGTFVFFSVTNFYHFMTKCNFFFCIIVKHKL